MTLYKTIQQKLKTSYYVLVDFNDLYQMWWDGELGHLDPLYDNSELYELLSIRLSELTNSEIMEIRDTEVVLRNNQYKDLPQDEKIDLFWWSVSNCVVSYNAPVK